MVAFKYLPEHSLDEDAGKLTKHPLVVSIPCDKLYFEFEEGNFRIYFRIIGEFMGDSDFETKGGLPLYAVSEVERQVIFCHSEENLSLIAEKLLNWEKSQGILDLTQYQGE